MKKHIDASTLLAKHSRVLHLPYRQQKSMKSSDVHSVCTYIIIPMYIHTYIHTYNIICIFSLLLFLFGRFSFTFSFAWRQSANLCDMSGHICMYYILYTYMIIDVRMQFSVHLHCKLSVTAQGRGKGRGEVGQ